MGKPRKSENRKWTRRRVDKKTKYKVRTRRKVLAVKYEISDDELQLKQERTSQESEDDGESDFEYIPIKRKKQKSSADVVEVVSKKKRNYDINKIWPCKNCGQIFRTVRMLITHRKNEHSKIDVNEHTYKFDEGQELYVCNTCSAEYQQEDEIEKHIQTHVVAFKSLKRKKQKSSADVVDIVKKKRNYDINKIWPCKKCDQIFRTKRTLITHRKNEHTKIDVNEHTYKFDEDQELYVCNTCSAEYQEEDEIEKHIKTHEAAFECTICNEKFKKAYDFGTHNATHSDDKMFRCPLCIYKTPKRTGLLIHINYVHLRKFSYFCKTCGKGFNDAVLYKEHNNEHLGIRPFSCIVCTKTFTYSRYLLTHQIRSHRVGIDGQLLPNQCMVCNKVFSKLATFQKHYEEKHIKNQLPHEKKHLCDTCGKGFSQKNKLRIHYRVHTGFKPYTCTYCAKSFTKKDYLVMHERVHSGEKPYSCQYCGKCFTQGAPLRIHLRTHTGERPYVCQWCSSGFTSRGALNMHCKNCTGQL